MGKNNRNPRPYIFVPLLIVFVIAVGVLAVFSAILSLTDADAGTTGIFAIAVFAGLCAVALLIWRLIALRRGHMLSAVDDNISSLESNLTLNLLNGLYMPVVLVNDANKIIWYNQTFADLAESKGVLYGKSFEEFCPIKPSALMKSQKTKGPVIAAFGAFYNIKAYSLPFEGKDMTLTVWNDCTELENANKKLLEEDPLVAFIVIDNLEDLMQYAQESYRSASAQVEGILRSWANSVDGIFREYERDKFIMVFHSKYLAQFIASKFDILDKIRDVRVGEGNLPVTVSVGISRLDGNLSEKEKSSRTALDTALQRGGDQVALKTQKGMEFYGGKVQTAQKRTKVKARVVSEELSHLMSQCENVLVMAHVYPDFDAIGASVGIARMASFCGARVNIVTNFSSPEVKKCVNRIRPSMAEGMFVDFDQAQELLTAGTLLVIVDVNNPTQFEAPDLVANARNIAVIDHHRKAAEFGYEPLITYIEPAASSACEMVAEMLENVLSPGLLPAEEANLMLAGIMLDTKHFSRNTGSRTFGAAQYLRNEGGNTSSAGELFRNELSDLLCEADYESNTIIYRSVIAIAKNSSVSAPGTDNRVAAAKAADKMLGIEGVEASFVVCHGEDSIHISGRSNGNINVQLILEKLGGGGHFDAAATRMTGVSAAQALTTLKNAIDEYLSENNNSKEIKK